MTALKRLLPVKLKHTLKLDLMRGMEGGFREMAREELIANLPPPQRIPPTLETLYTPWQKYPSEVLQMPPEGSCHPESIAGDFPIPPEDIMMGYQGNIPYYLQNGLETAQLVRTTLTRHGLNFGPETRVMDWGCATGRVLRHFREEAQLGEFWGVDQYAPCMLWAKQYLSPPFKFLTGSAIPHLPFEDNSFDAIYGISVMTHLEHLTDQWLMELRRILKPGGLCLLSAHTEASLGQFRTHFWPPWLDREFDQALLRDSNFCVVPGKGDWAVTYVFYREDYLQQEWGQYMEIIDMLPAQVPYAQTGVLMRKF